MKKHETEAAGSVAPCNGGRDVFGAMTNSQQIRPERTFFETITSRKDFSDAFHACNRLSARGLLVKTMLLSFCGSRPFKSTRRAAQPPV